MFEERTILKESELYRILGKKAKSNNPEIARRYIMSLIELIYEELRDTGKVRVYGLGDFWVTYVEAGWRNMPNPKGGFVRKYVEGYYRVKFKPSRRFIGSLNGRNYTNLKFISGEDKSRNESSRQRTDEEIQLEALEEEKRRRRPTKKEYAKKLEQVYQEKQELAQQIIEAKLFEEEMADYKARKHYGGKRSMIRVQDQVEENILDIEENDVEEFEEEEE